MSEDNDDWGTIDPKAVKEQEEAIEIEVEGQEEEAPEVEVEKAEEVEEKQETAPEETSNNNKPDEPKELEGIETQGAQKRIRRLVAQRNQEREEKAALERRIQEYEQKLKEKEEESVSAQRKNLEANEATVSNQMQLAEKAYKKALENGDADDIVEAQKSLYSATLQMDRINSLKENYKPVNEVDEKPQPQQQYQPPQEQPYAPNPADYDPKAVEWASKNPQFGQDQIFTATALAINEQLIDEGFDPSDDDFYEEIDRQMKTKLPSYYKQPVQQEEQPVEQPEVKAEPKKPSQVVAGASRTVSNPATGRNRKVKLTEADIAMAEKWKIPLERYAEQKLAAEAVEEGEYTTINIKRGGQ